MDLETTNWTTSESPHVRDATKQKAVLPIVAWHTTFHQALRNSTAIALEMYSGIRPAILPLRGMNFPDLPQPGHQHRFITTRI